MNKYCPKCGSRYIFMVNIINVDGFGYAYCSRNILFQGQTEGGCGWEGEEKGLLNEKQKNIFDRKKKLEKLK